MIEVNSALLRWVKESTRWGCKRGARHSQTLNKEIAMPKALRLAAAVIALAAGAATAPALAASFEVKMLNKGTDGTMVFEPALTRVAPGDTVTFVPVDKGHNAETIPGMLPEGAEPFKGKISQEVTVTFTVNGAYGVKCNPHFALGMVALIIVGDEPPANLSAITDTKVPSRARDRLDKVVAELAQ